MLKKYELLILAQLAKAVLPHEKQSQFSLENIHFFDRIQHLTHYCAPTFLVFVRLSLLALNIWSVLRFGRTLKNVPVEKVKRMMDQWAHSRAYIKYLLLRPLLVLIYTTYYSDPGVSADIGYQEKPKPIAPEAPKLETALIPHESLGQTIETEICIIGSGAGGAVMAKELSEKGHEVLIVEEGRHFPRSYFNQAPTLERNQSIYRDAGLVTTIGFPMILLPTGRAVGGTTLINSGTCFRTPPAVLDSWMKDFKLSDISEKHMAPFFERVEKNLKVAAVQPQVLGGNNEKIDAGVRSLGLKGFPLYRNAENCLGTGLCIFGCPTGAKQSVERNYLPQAVEHGAKILSQARAVKLNRRGARIESLHATLLEADGRTKRDVTIKARRFIVACGTLESPLLLKRSGLGLDSGQLGKNLSIHPTAKMMGLFDDHVGGDFGVPQGYGISDYEDRGMMFESVFFPPWLLATSIFQSGEKHWEIMRNYKKVGIFGFLVHDASRGFVKQGPDGRPLVFYNLGKKEKDLFVEGLKILGRLFFAAGAKKVYPTLRTHHEVLDQRTLEDLDPKKVHRRDLESAAFHPLGTCRMGGEAHQSVVGGDLKLHGMENIWVVDGSVLPTSLGVNPQVTIMAFATRTAEIIHAEA